MELFIVVAVLGILTAVAVPVFSFNAKRQKANDCANQRKVLEASIKEAMYGMVDNGKKQVFKCNPDGDSGYLVAGPNTSGTKEMCLISASGAAKTNIAGYTYKGFALNKCLAYQLNDNFTVGALRGGYRFSKAELDNKEPNANASDLNKAIKAAEIKYPTRTYSAGCAEGHFLKKYSLTNTPVYSLLANAELPDDVTKRISTRIQVNPLVIQGIMPAL